MPTERIGKALLIIIAIGIWINFLRPVTGSHLGNREYTFISMNAKGEFEAGGVGEIGFTGTGLGNALEAASKQGWKVHSVVCPNAGGYVVIIEK